MKHPTITDEELEQVVAEAQVKDMDEGMARAFFEALLKRFGYEEVPDNAAKPRR